MPVRRRDAREWHEGPLYAYRYAGHDIKVNVTGSSWPIRGVALAQGVCDVLTEFRRRAGQRVLDFGAGSWLRYVQCTRHMLPTREVCAVEFEEAFRDDASEVKRTLDADVTFWTPSRFANMRRQRFDLILLVNVLNTMPEEDHQRKVFAALADRLNPLGWLVVYQRIWTASENPQGAVDYGNGWLVPHSRLGEYTYRGKTGHKWFNALAAECELRPATTRAEISSSNTLLRVWEKPFD